MLGVIVRIRNSDNRTGLSLATVTTAKVYEYGQQYKHKGNAICTLLYTKRNIWLIYYVWD